MFIIFGWKVFNWYLSSRVSDFINNMKMFLKTGASKTFIHCISNCTNKPEKYRLYIFLIHIFIK